MEILHLISAAPNHPGFTFQIFIMQNEPVILNPFLEGFPFHCKNTSHATFFKGIIPSGYSEMRNQVDFAKSTLKSEINS